MKFLIKFLAIIAIIASSGCASSFKSGEGCNISYPSGYKDKVTALMSANLFDPYSAQFTMASPKLVKHKGKCVYLIDGTVNAKNRFGGYVGAQRFQVAIDGYGQAKQVNVFATSLLNSLQ